MFSLFRLFNYVSQKYLEIIFEFGTDENIGNFRTFFISFKIAPYVSKLILSVFVSLTEAVCSDPSFYLPIICLFVA